jgi:hypothetical protein
MGWKTVQTGGLLDNCTFGPVTECFFGFDDRRGKQIQLHLTGAVEMDEGDVPEFVEDAESHTLMWSCGKGWNTDDGGESVEHPKLEDFGSMSQVGIAIDGLLEVIGDDDKTLKLLQGQGDPTTAEAWLGLKVHLVRRTIQMNRPMKVKDEETGEERTVESYEVLVPDRVLEIGGTAVGKSSGGSKAAKAKKAEPEPEPETNGEGKLTAEQIMELGADADNEASEDQQESIDTLAGLAQSLDIDPDDDIFDTWTKVAEAIVEAQSSNSEEPAKPKAKAKAGKGSAR